MSYEPSGGLVRGGVQHRSHCYRCHTRSRLIRTIDITSVISLAQALCFVDDLLTLSFVRAIKVYWYISADIYVLIGYLLL